jgi:hypothetical protein
MRQRGAYVAIETRFVNPRFQEISAENIDCDKKDRQGATGAFYVKIGPFADGEAPKILGWSSLFPGQVNAIRPDRRPGDNKGK